MTIFEILNRESICEDCFFFEVTDEAMTCSGREEVAEEERIEEDTLSAKYHGTHEDTGFVHFEEGKKMHALIIC